MTKPDFEKMAQMAACSVEEVLIDCEMERLTRHIREQIFQAHELGRQSVFEEFPSEEEFVREIGELNYKDCYRWLKERMGI